MKVADDEWTGLIGYRGKDWWELEGGRTGRLVIEDQEA